MSAPDTFWNNLAEDYAKKLVANPEAFERKIAVTKQAMSADHVVLDIGCGTGSLALRLAPSAAHVHGLDLSREMIRIAEGKARDQGVANVSFHVGAFDETFAVLEDGSLDGICAYNILHLVEDRAGALARIHRLLKPGGFFVSSTACLSESWMPYRLILGVMRALGKAPMVAIFRKRRLLEEMRAAGFVEIDQPDVGAEPTIAFVVARKPPIHPG